MLFLDNTMVSGFKRCPRYYYLRHIRFWRGDRPAMPLIFGLSWGDAMNAIWLLAGELNDTNLITAGMSAFAKKWNEETEPFKEELTPEVLKFRNPDTALEMIAGYVYARGDWIRTHCQAIRAELPFAIVLSGHVTYIGRKDKLAVIDNKLTIVDHKTTSDYRKDGGFSPDFMDQFQIDSQILGYMVSEGAHTGEHVRALIDGALVHASVHDKFRFIEVQHDMNSAIIWVDETIQWSHKIIAARDRTPDIESRAFPKNTESCFGRYGRCPYFGICSTVPSPEYLDRPPDGFVEEEWKPFEIHKIGELPQYSHPEQSEETQECPTPKT